jgi:Ti-type conjugative transfer relaxase TraA
VLSIGQAQGSYYASLATEDYYHAGGEPPGVWHGKGLEFFGLSGEVNKDEFLTFCDGFSLDGEALTQNAGREDHRAGWDLTFSAPKSVSVLWSQADSEMRQELQAAQLEAVKKALDYLEREAAFTRRGKGGIDFERCKLIFATFEHGTSRAQDPQLHTHAVLLNVGIRDDGTTGSLETKPIFRHKMTAGALYRAELAHQLTELGFAVEKTKDAFELKGVGRGIIEEFSKRREEIEAAMKTAGARGAARAAHFTRSTREKKEHVAREVLFTEWQRVGKAHNFSYSQVIDQERKPVDREAAKQRAVLGAVEKLTQGQAYFSEKDLLRRSAEEGVGKINAGDVSKAVSTYLTHEAISLGRGRDGERYYTTPEIDALEKRMLAQVEAAKAKTFPLIKSSAVKVSQTLNAEQKIALYHITDEQGAIKVVSGMAGTGKTMLLSSARGVWEAQGFEVKGAALAAVAAKGLQEGAGIKSDTIHKTLFDIEKGRLTLMSKTVLVIDEAGMVGTRQMSGLIDAATRWGARLVLVGDEKQLQPIEHGNPFKAIGERTGRSELTDIKRQRESWAQDAVKDFARGEAGRGLRAYIERELLYVGDMRKEATAQLIADWNSERGRELKDSLILAGTRATVSRLNHLAQDERRSRGELKEARGVEVNKETIFEGDRVLFTRNKKPLGVRNGDLGTVKEVDPFRQVLTVSLDSGERVKVPLSSYEHIQLGYAVTTHKAQGATVERAYILAGGSMQDRELSYVQMSRSKGQTKIYTERAEVGDTIAELSKTMSRSRQKELAQDIIQQVVEDTQRRQLERGLSL